ncbi:MAG: ABC transporter substrate-binding protein [Actinobacteria bacterium]|nr:ABC transporter substrate-binding protein [Actinomycetota bacterium]
MRQHRERGRVAARQVVTLVLAAVLALGACGANPAEHTGGEPQRPTGPTVLRVALFPAGATLPARIALTQGMFERHGLRVEITEGTDLPVFMAALAKGQYDIAQSGPTLALIGAEKHLDVQIVAGLARQSQERPNAVWVTKDPTIDTVTELRGKTVAVPSLTGLIVDSLVYLLGLGGVGRDEVRFVAVPFPAMGDQLEAGNVDAAVATIPFFTSLAARGFLVHDDIVVAAVHAASAGSLDTAITSVWAAPNRLGRDHPETVRAFRRSLTEAVDFLEADESRARTLMQSWLKIPPQVIQHAPLPDWTVEMTAQQLAPYSTIARAAGSTTSEPDVGSLVWQGP